MKPDAILINTSRGQVIDERALVAALKSGRLAAAALDTFANEPIEHDNPLLELENVVLSPHTAAMTDEALSRMGTMAAAQLLDYLHRGVLDVDNLANPAVAERLSESAAS
jgi:D-3-phosphoglycerate dehydrogenase / 2-oxoglutarate reductase